MNEQRNYRQPDIPIPENAEIGVSRQEFDEHRRDFAFQKSLLHWTFGFIVAILIVCFIAFITFIIDTYKFHTKATQDYNNEIQKLKSENKHLKFKDFDRRLNEMEKENENLKSEFNEIIKNSNKEKILLTK